MVTNGFLAMDRSILEDFLLHTKRVELDVASGYLF